MEGQKQNKKLSLHKSLLFLAPILCTKQRTIFTVIEYGTRNATESNKTRVGNKRYTLQFGKEEIKLSVFANKIIIYVEIPRNVQQKS